MEINVYTQYVFSKGYSKYCLSDRNGNVRIESYKYDTDTYKWFEDSDMMIDRNIFYSIAKKFVEDYEKEGCENE